MNTILKNHSYGKISNCPFVHACNPVDFAGVVVRTEEGEHSFQSYSKQAPELCTDSVQQQGTIWTHTER